jgi:hypothetical protein
MYYEAQGKLDEMINLLVEAGITLKDLYYIDPKDDKTTLYESISGLYEDTFEKEIERERARENAYWDKIDAAFEKWRDEQ